jgi:hypothetical protein
VTVHRWTLATPLLLALALSAPSAQAFIPPDLGYVDTGSAAYQRFKDYVDSELGGVSNYAFSATDAALEGRLAPANPAYCQRAVLLTEQQVAAAEAAIAGGGRPDISGDSYLEVGAMIRDLALTLDWCAAQVSPSQRTRWSAYAEQAVWNVWHPDDATWGGQPFPWSGFATSDPGDNYYYSFLEATMYWAMVSPTTGPSWKSFLETQKLPPLVAYFAALPGGGSREGTGYGLSHMRLFELYRLWRDYTGTDLGAQSTHRDNSIEWWIHATVPTLDRIAPIGDQARVSYPDLYDYHRNVMLQARAGASSATARAHASWWLSQISIPEMTSGFNFRHDLLSAGGTPTPPTALYYQAQGTGLLFARTGWDRNAMWLSFMAGTYDQSHAAQDQGAFTLFSRDFLAVTENIFTHSGIAQETPVQNVLRFVRAGSDIPQRTETTSTMTVTPGSNGAIDAHAVLTPAYAGDPGVIAWTRDLHFADRVLTVHDFYTVGSGTQAIFQINTPAQPVVDPVTRTARAGNLAIKVIKPAAPGFAVLDWRTVDSFEYRAGWKLEITGTGGEFQVELSDATTLFADGFE